MSEELSRTKPRRPAAAWVTQAEVVRVERLSSSFVRVTLALPPGDDGAPAFAPMGFDQWFRLFLPQEGAALHLPHGDADGWHGRWLAMDDAVRPVVRNYTVRDARPGGDGRWEVDVDLVVHRHPGTGEVEGLAAGWALRARPGDRVGLLDQGLIIDPRPGAGELLVVADESGLPAAESTARSLPVGARARFVLEVPHPDDRRDLPSAADVEVLWAVRDGAPVGAAAMGLLGTVPLAAAGYVYAVGEAALALEVRRRAQAAGLAKRDVDFCAYWRAARSADLPTRAS